MMNCATFHLYGDLNFFLSKKRKHTPFQHHFDWRATIKDMIESFGVPHCELALIVVNGQSVDFDYIVRDGDYIEACSDFDAVAVPNKISLRPPNPKPARFILDTHLGKLASYLRMMGFDTLYRNDYPDDLLAQISHDEERILLTRDIGLLKRSLVVYGYYVRNTNPRKRIVEVFERFDLPQQVVPFKFCMKCNGLLTSVPKAEVIGKLQYRTAEYYDEFHQCTSCDRIYWKGPHYERMQEFMGEVLGM